MNILTYAPFYAWIKVKSRVMLFKVWFQDQQYQHFLGARNAESWAPHQNYWIWICILTILAGNLYTQNKPKKYWSRRSGTSQTIHDESVLFSFLNFQSVVIFCKTQKSYAWIFQQCECYTGFSNGTLSFCSYLHSHQ